MTEAEVERSISDHEARNAALRRLFVEKALDLKEARLIECNFWAWSESDAMDLAEALTKRGFRILTRRPAAVRDDPLRWNLEAARTQSIERTLDREFTEGLVRLANLHSANYDGWGTTV